MDRRVFVQALLTGTVGSWLPLQVGCRGHQYGHVLKDSDKDMVGSHTAGAETWKPLVCESVAKLLARQQEELVQVSHVEGELARKRICFVGVENKSAEELGDAREQLYEMIDEQLQASEMFVPLTRRVLEAALNECRLRPDQLFIPNNQRQFAACLEREGQPIDYLMFAKVTTLSTQNNKSSQRDYRLTLELVNINTGTSDKESAELRKGYHKTKIGKLKNYGAGGAG